MNQCSKCLYLLFAFLFILIWCTLGASGNQAKRGPGGQIVFSDSAFVPSDWNETLIFSLNGGTYSSSQENSGGNPGSYRYIVHTLPPPPPYQASYIQVMHIYTRESFQPFSSGAIDSLSYAEDQVQFSPPYPGTLIGVVIALRQNSRFYIDLKTNHTPYVSATSWTSRVVRGIVATDFVEFLGFSSDYQFLADTTSHPDFSVTGGSIAFGSLRGNSSGIGGGGCVTYHGFDNWSVTLHLRAEYLCGDANGDGAVDISDAVYLITYIFAGGPAPNPLASGDANCDQAVDISDAVYLIQYIFAGGPAPCAGCK